MPWLIIAVFAWGILLFMIGRQGLKRCWPGGLSAMIIQLFVDANLIRLGLYKLNYRIFQIDNITVLYSLMVFAMGTLFVYYLPKNAWLKIGHIVVWSLLFFAEERLLIYIQALEYLHWNYWGSIHINILTMAFLALLAETFNYGGLQYD